MARKHLSRWGVVAAWSACMVLGIAAGSLPAQNIFKKLMGGGSPTPVRPSQVRDLKKAGDEAYQKGDFAAALNFYTQAHANQAELTPTEQKDLEARIGQNVANLNKQNEGAALLRRAEELFKQNQPEESAALLNEISTNQFLTPGDRQAKQALAEKLGNLTTSLKTAPNTPVSSPKELLRLGREALRKNEFDQAETLGKQAQANWGTSWNLFGDTPSKLLRDVQDARRVASPTPPESPKKEASGPSFLPKIFGKKDPPPTLPAPPVSTPQPPPGDPVNKKAEQRSEGEPTAPIPGSAVSGSPVTQVSRKEPIAPGLTPAEASKKDVPVSANNPYENTPKTASTAPASVKKAQAQELVRFGYKALEAGDIAMARKYAEQAKALRPDLEYWEQNPERLLSDIQKRTDGKAPTTGAGTLPAATQGDPRQMVRDARALLEKGQIDEAEKLAGQAGTVRAHGWGLFEDSPDKIRNDVIKLRTKRDREESTKVLAEARRLFNTGQVEESKKLAYKAQALHGPYSTWEPGDRPQKLLEDIHRVELTRGPSPFKDPLRNVAQQKVNQVAKETPRPTPTPAQPSPRELPVANTPPANPYNGNPPMAPPTSYTPNQPPAVASADPANRQRAMAILAEARQLQQAGRVVEARQKALEADRLNVQFGPFDDSPKTCLAHLATAGQMQIGVLLQQTNQTLSNPTDPARFQKAEVSLMNARQLAVAFELDPAPIDFVTAQVKQLQFPSAPIAQGIPTAPGLPTPPVTQVQHVQPPIPAPNGDRNQLVGMEKLDKARLEIKTGNLAMARRLAEDACNPMYGVRTEALAVIRSIDAEENFQRANAAKRNADAGLDAFHRRDYGRAVAILKEVDIFLLNPEQQSRIKQIMATREMQSDYIVQTGAKTPALAQDPSLKNAVQNDIASVSDNLAESVRAMETIQAQKLRDQGLVAQRKAMDAMNTGDPQGAIKQLQEYLNQLDQAQIDPAKVAQLRRPVEFRMQQYKTTLAQRDLASQQQTALKPGHKESERNAKIRKTQDDVVECMDRYRALYKEGKFKEALAEAQKAQELDNDNVAAGVAVQMCMTKIAIRESETNRRRADERFLTELNNDTGENVTTMQPVAFNREVWQRAQNRELGKKGFYSNTMGPIERAIERKLKEPTSLNFKDTPLSQVISDLQVLTGINVVADKNALREIGVSLEQPLSVKVENISLKSALNILLSELRLTYVIQDEALKITTPMHAKGNLKMVTYPVADLVVPVENHPTPDINNLHHALMRHMGTTSGVNNLGPLPQSSLGSLPPTGQPVSSMSSGTAPGSNFAMNSQSHGGGMQTNVSKQMASTMEDLLINLVTGTISQDSWASVGGKGTIQYFPLGMALVINQTQEVQEEVAALLAALRRLQELEVAIEMKLVSVSEAFFERMGVDFDVNVRTNNSVANQNMLLTQQFQPFGKLNTFQPNNFVSGLTPAGTFTPDLSVPIRSTSFDFTAPTFGGYPGTLTGDGGIALGLAFLSDIQVFMFMEAAQGDRRTNVMQAPKITVFNGQTANITVNDQQFFLTGVTINAAGSQLFFQPNNQPFPLGVNLQVTPVVSADRRFVRLNLTPQMTNLASATVPLIPVQIPVPQIFDGPGQQQTVGQPVIFQMFFQQPTFTQIFLNTTVNVPDGGTVLLGGLKTLSEARNEYGPPILSKIPYISRLFRNVGYGREAQSLMIMVTPRIIINEEEEQIYTGALPPIPRN